MFAFRSSWSARTNYTYRDQQAGLELTHLLEWVLVSQPCVAIPNQPVPYRYDAQQGGE